MRSQLLPILLAPLLLVLASCDRSSSSGGGVVNSKKLSDFAGRTSLVIPASAKAIHYKHYYGMDSKINVTLEIPTADLATFLTASGLDADVDNTTRSKSLPAMFGDFVPKMPTKFREGQKKLPGDCWLNVLVDEDSPTEALVHLTWFDV